MLRFLTLFPIFLVSFYGKTQQPCLPTSGGIPAGDEPPGCFVCGPIYQGSTVGYTADSLDFDFPCGTIENNQWISVRSNNTGLISATILSTNCLQGKGVELAIYNEDLDLISNCFSSGGTKSIGNVSVSNLPALETIYIMIDGYEGDECDILITIDNGIIFPGPPDFPVLKATPDFAVVCTGMEICYETNAVRDATEYTWEIPGNGIITEGGAINQTHVCVEYFSAGNGNVKVTPSNICFPGIPAKDSVIVTDTIVGPQINCTIDVGQILFSWNPVSGADEYSIFINGDYVVTAFQTQYFFNPTTAGDSIKIEIRPQGGDCFYKPGVLVCANPTSSLSNQIQLENISILPNPTTGQLQIQSDIKIKTLTVFNPSGKQILSNSTTVIDLSSFGPGVFYLKIFTEKGIVLRKAVLL